MFRWKCLLIILVLLSIGTKVHGAPVSFDALACGADMRSALIGRHMPNERVVVTELKYRQLSLKDNGGEELGGRLFLISWQICGREYFLLEENDFVLDVLESPVAGGSPLGVTAFCSIDGKKIPEVVVAFRAHHSDKKAFRPISGWKIDKSKKKFVELQIGSIECGV